jgi:hypothetical protein
MPKEVKKIKIEKHEFFTRVTIKMKHMNIRFNVKTVQIDGNSIIFTNNEGYTLYIWKNTLLENNYNLELSHYDDDEDEDDDNQIGIILSIQYFRIKPEDWALLTQLQSIEKEENDDENEDMEEGGFGTQLSGNAGQGTGLDASGLGGGYSKKYPRRYLSHFVSYNRSRSRTRSKRRSRYQNSARPF